MPCSALNMSGCCLSFIWAEIWSYDDDDCVWMGWDHEVEPLCYIFITAMLHNLTLYAFTFELKAIFPVLLFDIPVDFTHTRSSQLLLAREWNGSFFSTSVTQSSLNWIFSLDPTYFLLCWQRHLRWNRDDLFIYHSGYSVVPNHTFQFGLPV